MATQQVSDIANSEIADVVLENCPTKILLPNAEARNPGSREFYGRLGLNERELELLQVSVPKQHYYVVSKLGRRLVDLRLGKVALAWLGVSGREERQIVQSVMDEYPSTWRTEWLRLKVPTWSDYFRTWNPQKEGGRIVMRKSLVLLLLLLLFCSPPGPALAGPYATEVTQILNHVQLVLSYAAQANQLATQIKMLADAIKNTVNNPHQLFWNIQADLNALAGIVQGGRSLAYSLGNYDALWHQTYPGYGGYAPTGYYNRYQAWSQTTLDTVVGAMRAAGLQGQQLNSEVTLIQNLEAQSQSADGRLLALNVATQMADQQDQQMQKLRELMLADMQSKAAYYGTVIQQQADQTAASQYFFQYAPAPPMALDSCRDGTKGEPMRTHVILSSLLLLMLCACTRERPSRIVKLAEEAGAGQNF
jgi:type IV secretion system protein TrbJ